MTLPSAFMPHAARILNPLDTSLNSPVKQARFARFFSRWPRFGMPSDVELNARYFGGAFVVALPFFIIAAVVVLLGCCFSLQRSRARRKKRDESSGVYSNSSSTRSGHWHAKRAVVGALFFSAAFFLVALGAIATFSFHSGLEDVFDALAFGVDGVYGSGIALTRFILELLDRVENAPVIGNILELLGNVVNVRDSAKSFVATNFPVLTETRNILKIVRRAGTAAYGLMIALFVTLFAGLLCVLLLSRRVRVGKGAGCWVLLMLFPMVTAWVALGVVSAVGALAGDSCDMLGNYHRIILDAAIGKEVYAKGVSRTKNLIYDRGVKCPRDLLESGVLDNLQGVVVDVLGSGVADDLIGSLFDLDSGAGVSRFSSVYFRGLLDCSTLVRFSGRTHQAMCAPKGPMDAMFAIWLSLLLLAVVLTVSYFASQYAAFDATAFLIPALYKRTGDDNELFGSKAAGDNDGHVYSNGIRMGTPSHSVDIEGGGPMSPGYTVPDETLCTPKSSERDVYDHVTHPGNTPGRRDGMRV